MELLGSTKKGQIDIIGQLRQNIIKDSLKGRQSHPFDKKKLWKIFQSEFKNLFGKEFLYDDIILHNIAPIFYYFLESDQFFKCQYLRADISTPSFKKGLLLLGNVGVGKTHIMMVFEKIFSRYPPHRFKIYSTQDLVNEYEGLANLGDKNYFKQKHSSGIVLYDDLNSERLAKDFGFVNIMDEIIKKRYSEGKKTHLTLNPIPGSENDPLRTIQELSKNYDERTVDRLFDMFNIIEFKGKSMRR
ncbi:ATP-binding protein [Gelidibacter mesophilus]|uniref:ATP-binding protein n=1 Tax=Gelidibacter mesophilus TaxID=169050 RepID=UPI0003FDC892|nr:ATP-binding protein [Gelidibacter mesophilus]